jgi:hypothetical protein
MGLDQSAHTIPVGFDLEDRGLVDPLRFSAKEESGWMCGRISSSIVRIEVGPRGSLRGVRQAFQPDTLRPATKRVRLESLTYLGLSAVIPANPRKS